MVDYIRKFWHLYRLKRDIIAVVRCSAVRQSTSRSLIFPYSFCRVLLCSNDFVSIPPQSTETSFGNQIHNMGMKYTDEQKELITAARLGDLETIKALIERGDAIDCELKYGSSALMIAASRGHEDVVRLLAAHGAKVNRRNKFGATALLEACEKGHGHVIRALAELGADINLAHNKGSTVLFSATTRRDIQVIRVLLELGADPDLLNFEGWSARRWAESEANPALMELFGNSKKGAKEDVQSSDQPEPSPESKEEVSETKTKVVVVNDAFWIALMRAASVGDVEAVRRLADEGVEVNGQSPNGTTPLITAVKNGRADAVFELLELGADLSHTDAEGLDALAWAHKTGQSLIIEGLKERGITSDESLKQ
jgi:ankyrin repeat protein